ncbi:MAG TPA: hypothetical protein VGN49_08075 [Micrococcaceae bacterium]|nr:hypothetical protein [Micrococcaceae bacterium]
MTELPEGYQQYLSDKTPRFIETVLPVMEQSVAEQLHGVHVRLLPGGNQAFMDPNLAYGEVVEGLD